jgi:hypothetical protein
MSTLPQHPIPDSYWIVEGKLLAGEYPRTIDEQESVVKLAQILDAGITYFIDISEQGEKVRGRALIPYDYLLAAEATARGRNFKYLRMAWRDLGVPDPQQMTQILDTIDAAIADGEVVYIHCWGGIGRTGVAAGCYLVRHGWQPGEALALIAKRRKGTPDGYRPSPETRE